MEKYVCLSFDDGPNIEGDNTMSNMLDVLEKHNVVASFFLIGNKINEKNKDVILRAYNMGCDIQNHSWSHPFMSKLSKEQMKEEFDKCENEIVKITGKNSQFFRPPYIDVNEELFSVIPNPFICGYGVEDWVAEVTAEQRFERMMESVKDGTIFLLHVMEKNDATVQAVDRLIVELKKQGYTFVNLPDLFIKEGVDPKQPNAMWTFLK